MANQVGTCGSPITREPDDAGAREDAFSRQFTLGRRHRPAAGRLQATTMMARPRDRQVAAREAPPRRVDRNVKVPLEAFRADMKSSATPAPISEQAIRVTLGQYKCPLPFEAVRTTLLGNISSPQLDLSPMTAITSIWGGRMPEFSSETEVQPFFEILAGLWNQLVQHQNSRQPFRLVRPSVEPTRQSLVALALTRKMELAGFVNGLFGDAEQMHLPEKGHQAIEKLAEAHAMFAGAAELLADDAKPASSEQLVEFARNAQQMTLIAETLINKAIQSCKRARANHLEAMAKMPTERRILH